MSASPPQILLIRLSSLGDLVLATAAVGPLAAAGCRVSLVTKAEFAPLFRGQPGIAEVYAFDKKNGGEAAARTALFDWAAGRRFDLILDLQNSWRTFFWRRTLRRFAPVRALAKPRIREWLVIGLRLGALAGLGRGGRARRFRDFALSALASLGLRAPDGVPLTRLEAGAAEREAVRSLLPEGDFAVLLPGGAWKSKEWPYFPELARQVARRAPVVVLGGAKDGLCETVANAAREVNPESRTLHGRTSLRESMAVLAAARWVVGNDTGMVHVAEALGRDVAMIEGPTHPFMGFSPHREGSLALGLPLVCRPCSKSGRVCVRFGTRLCLRGLAPEEVARQLRAGGFPC